MLACDQSSDCLSLYQSGVELVAAQELWRWPLWPETEGLPFAGIRALQASWKPILAMQGHNCYCRGLPVKSFLEKTKGKFLSAIKSSYFEQIKYYFITGLQSIMLEIPQGLPSLCRRMKLSKINASDYLNYSASSINIIIYFQKQCCLEIQ